MSKHRYFVYILSSQRNGTLYIGITSDISRRIDEHRKKMIPGFTKKYGVAKLVYAEEYEYVGDALSREKQLKKWKRDWKLNLIEKANPEWKDLSCHLI
jgi:putative endonuclease